MQIITSVRKIEEREFAFNTLDRSKKFNRSLRGDLLNVETYLATYIFPELIEVIKVTSAIELTIETCNSSLYQTGSTPLVCVY